MFLRVLLANLQCRCAYNPPRMPPACALSCLILIIQSLTEQLLSDTCVIKGSALMLPWCCHASHMCSIALTLPCRHFKYYAKDFGDNESERLATLIRLSGGRGNDLRKVISPVALL